MAAARSGWGTVVIVALALATSACMIRQLATTKGEREAGRIAAQQVAEQIGLVQAGAPVGYLQALGARLAEHSPRAGVEFSFHVVDIVETNAFALPGGHIYISRGLLALTNSEDELASVIAHEIGHVSARHHLKGEVRRAPFLPLRIATRLGGLATGILSRRLGRTVAAIGGVPGSLILSTHSRRQEREADEIGQRIAAAAGYDPAALASVMRTLGREEALLGHDPERRSFFASHPGSPERARQAESRAAGLDRTRSRSITSDRRGFLRKLEGLLVGPSAADGVFVENRFLHRDLGFTLRFPADWKTYNRPTVIAGASADGTAMVVLGVAGKGDDPLATARVAQAQDGLRLDAPPEATRVGELPAARALGRSGGSRLALLWIAHRGLVYQLSGIAEQALFEERRTQLLRVMQSFRPLAATERSQVLEARLRIVEARAEETLEALVERYDSPWSPEQAAVANALSADEKLAAGRPIKLARLEVYRGGD